MPSGKNAVDVDVGLADGYRCTAMRRSLSVWLLACAGVCAGFAQATKLVDCSGDRAYRDNRNGVGGPVFCEHVLPGSLAVKDGPFRFWFDPDFEGSSGDYSEGRQVGKWKECDRFGRCEQKDYPAIYPEEKQRPGFKPEIPVTYVEGKYIFDFASCRSTWVTHRDGGKADLDLNINALADGCLIAHIPADAAGHEGNADYTCTIPFQTGRRAFASLDLLTEFPKAGLPQYCAKQVFKTGPYMSSVDPNRGEGAAQVFTAEFSLGNNGVGISQARLHFQERAGSRTDRCVVRYDPGSKSLYLLSDQPGKYLGPIAAAGNASLWNNRCFLAGCSQAEVTVDTLKVHFAVRFNAAHFAGSHNMFLEIVDSDRHASPAAGYGHWSVPAESTEPAAEWPSDRSCPAATPVAPLGVHTSSVVNCKDASGTWSDPETGGTWSLSQTGGDISGSLTITKPECGRVSWRVTGQMNGDVATLKATEPIPAVDKCGAAPAASIAATLTPDCKTGSGRVEVQK
ncbi:MAG: hypothetical protein ABSH46_11545 [Bryobacteraceae bacterium]